MSIVRNRSSNFRSWGDGIIASLFMLGIFANSALGQRLEPGLHDLVVLDPGAHRQGLPAVHLEPGHDCRTAGDLVVDIPPAVHVHRYYYSGDKEIQGPIITGGPTIVVANHPKTGERMYVDAVLPAGAPRIAYDKSGITYVYPRQRVRIHYSAWRPDVVTVEQMSGQGLKRQVRSLTQFAVRVPKQIVKNSEFLQSARETSVDGGQVVVGAAGVVDAATGTALDKLRELSAYNPLVSTLQGAAQNRPYRKNLIDIRKAAAEKAKATLKFIPTNR